MPKKKTAKSNRSKASATRTRSVDDHSFLIIAGGGFVILLIIGLFLMNVGSIRSAVAHKMPGAMVEQTHQTVVIKDFSFSPATLTVKVGSTVTWLNSDSVAHSAVADDGTFDTKLLAPGERGSYTFTKAGTYTYKCGIHPSMTGTVVVEE